MATEMIHCPWCGTASRIILTDKNENEIKRLRECLRTRHQFWTIETYADLKYKKPHGKY